MTVALDDIVSRALESARQERTSRLSFADECANLLRYLPDTLHAERQRRGLSARRAALEVGINEDTWRDAEAGRRALTMKCLIPVLRWLAEGVPSSPCGTS